MTWPAIPWRDVPIAPAALMRRVDEEARRAFGIEPRQLMEVAGFQVARFVDDWAGGVSGRRLAVLAGSGNNGGDALVAARFLAQRGAQVVAWIVEPTDPASLAGVHARTARAMGIECAPANRAIALRADVIVDGLLGTGIRLPLREPAAAVIDAMNGSGAPIVAIDVPSGLDSETGDGEGGSVRAAATLTLGLPKPALRRAPSCGRVFLADIGLPPGLFAGDRSAVAAVYRVGDLLELVGPDEA